jgi:hypothetical protein
MTTRRDTPALPALLRFSGAIERDPEIDRWLDRQPNSLGRIGRSWFHVMRRCGPDVRELMHDGYATVCVEDAPFGYVGIFEAHVNVGFFQGATLPDPMGLLEGTGKRMRHVKLKPDSTVPESALRALIASAYLDIVEKVQAHK